MKKIQISPSILSADFSQLGNEIRRLETDIKKELNLGGLSPNRIAFLIEL